MTDARIEVTCPGCDRPFHVAADEQGRVADCPHCGGWVDVPDLSRPPTAAELDEAAAERNLTEYERQLAAAARQLEQSQRGLDQRDEQDAQYARQLAEAARQLEQARRALDTRDGQDQRFDHLLDRLDAVIGRWEQLAARMGLVAERLGGGPDANSG